MNADKDMLLSPEAESQLRESLKRCSPETVKAALAYRRDRDTEHVPVLVIGIIERFLEIEYREKIREGKDGLLLVEDLGIDSLMMVEIVILIEETLGVSIQNEELLELSTLGDVKSLIYRKMHGIPTPRKPQPISMEEIESIVPIQRPFLFLEEATVQTEETTGWYRIRGDEFFFPGHFKEEPVFPASIMIEALGQLAVLHLLKSDNGFLEGKIDPNKIFFTSCDGVRCHRVCKPGDVLDLDVRLKQVRYPLANFEGKISTVGQKVAYAQSLSLTFGYVD